jgi:hypothetical protein
MIIITAVIIGIFAPFIHPNLIIYMGREFGKDAVKIDNQIVGLFLKMGSY